MTIATIYFAVLFGDRAVASVSNDVFLRAMTLGFITFSVISAAGIYFSFYRGRVSR